MRSRRSYGVYARAVNVQASAASVAMAKTDAAAERATKKQQDRFWMRDPKTGCWIPENRFEEVDVVDLRNRMIRHN